MNIKRLFEKPSTRRRRKWVEGLDIGDLVRVANTLHHELDGRICVIEGIDTGYGVYKVKAISLKGDEWYRPDGWFGPRFFEPYNA